MEHGSSHLETRRPETGDETHHPDVSMTQSGE